MSNSHIRFYDTTHELKWFMYRIGATVIITQSGVITPIFNEYHAKLLFEYQITAGKRYMDTGHIPPKSKKSKI